MLQVRLIHRVGPVQAHKRERKEQPGRGTDVKSPLIQVYPPPLHPRSPSALSWLLPSHGLLASILAFSSLFYTLATGVVIG